MITRTPGRPRPAYSRPSANPPQPSHKIHKQATPKPVHAAPGPPDSPVQDAGTHYIPWLLFDGLITLSQVCYPGAWAWVPGARGY